MEKVSWITQMIDNGLLNQILQGPIGSVAGSLILLIIGIFVAFIVKSLVLAITNKLTINERLKTTTDSSLNVESILGKVAFWLMMIMALSAALNVLDITLMSESLAKMVGQILLFLPTLFAIAAIALIGWIIASIARTFIQSLLQKVELDKKLKNVAHNQAMSGFVADSIYWFILLLVFTSILGKLEMNGLFTPLNTMLTTIMGFIPNILMAIVIFALGIIGAKIVKGLVISVVATTSLNTLTSKAGLSNSNANSLPNAVGSFVSLFIILSTTLIALDTLHITIITEPVSNMLTLIMESLPSIFVAITILVISYFIGKLLTNIAKDLLESTTINDLPKKVGLDNSLPNKQLSELLATTAMAYIMIFASIMASNVLGFIQLSELIAMFITFSGNVVLGAMVMFIGFWLANLVANMIKKSDQGSAFLANLVRILIIGFVLALGLKTMGIADSIVNLAFGLTLGSVTVAFALSFGLGGQEAAARLLKHIQDTYEKKS